MLVQGGPLKSKLPGAREDLNPALLVRVLVNARYLASQATDQKSQTALLTTADEQTSVQNFSSLGAIAAEK
jgi:hypothetical protein